jgi:hypothetical protein
MYRLQTSQDEVCHTARFNGWPVQKMSVPHTFPPFSTRSLILSLGQAGNHVCVFEESNRGKRSSKYAPLCRWEKIRRANLPFTRKHEQLTKSLRKMERTLDTVLRSISNPNLAGLAGGMVSHSPSPGPDGESSIHDATGTPDHRHQDFQNAMTEASISHLPNTATYGAAVAPAPGSPRLHSLPDNVLNPLGLLAEASSSLRRSKQALGHSPSSAGGSGKNPMSLASLDNPKVGVANLGVYFKPGPMTILPLRQLIIERQVQVSTHPGSLWALSLMEL